MTSKPQPAFVEDDAEETVPVPVTRRRIYAYTIPGASTHQWERTVGGSTTTGVGRIKVGETTKPDARTRIKQQLGTAYPSLNGVDILLDVEAQREDGTWFGDRDVHRRLQEQGITRDGEWFDATLDEVKAAIVAVRHNKPYASERTLDFPMRPEQESAVAYTAGYFTTHAGDPGHPPKFLWNAKMRFGKTFTTYQLAREMGWTRILVLTYKPAVQAAWRDDLISHVDFEGWHFVNRDVPEDTATELADSDAPLVWFASFQDVTGKTADGKVKSHNEVIGWIDWDCIVIDEYHFGAWRESARALYDPSDAKVADLEEPEEPVTEDDLDLNASHYLYLSGTPFRALTNGEFTEDQIFNWTYVDEQHAKHTWDTSVGANPYVDLPEMQMYAYEMGPSAAQWAEDGEVDEFNLSTYFAATKADPTSTSKKFDRGTHVFTDPTRVSEFLEMLRGKLTGQMKTALLGSTKKAPFPYESPDFTDAIRHCVWYLPDVASCFAMRDLLEAHPYFNGYRVHVAAGTRAGLGAKAKPPVVATIDSAQQEHASGSITLSCGKLMTGVTIPQWGAILMLRSLKSPESYFQAAFRVQSPWSHREPDGTSVVRKPRVFVFEFDPNRALSLVAEYGMKLATTSEETPQTAIADLMSYLPIFQFVDGQMRQLDASDVLSIATTGVGATALAARWNSPVLVEVNEHTLSALLEHPDLLATLEQLEQFSNLADLAHQVVTSTKNLKKATLAKGKDQLDADEKKARKESAKTKRAIREKLQAFLAKVPVFMYVTDYREAALKDVIESLDSDLFTRVTGLTVEDFQLLNTLGLFNPEHMNAAIYQFRAFETQSLHYADDTTEAPPASEAVGGWDTVHHTPTGPAATGITST